MQITAELDNQQIEKLHELEKALRKNTSELISLAIDETYQRHVSPSAKARKPTPPLLLKNKRSCRSIYRSSPMQAIEISAELDQHHPIHVQLPKTVKAHKAKVIVMHEDETSTRRGTETRIVQRQN